MPNITPDVLQNIIDSIDSSSPKYDQRPKSERYKGRDGEGDWLSIVWAGHVCKFTARVVADKNKVCGHTRMLHNVPIPDDTGTEKRVLYSVEGVKKSTLDENGNTVFYTDWEEKDPILRYALQMNKLYGVWKFRPRLSTTYYGDIVDIEVGGTKYFKKGPCILGFNGEDFNRAFISACNTLRGKKSKDGKPVGEALLTATLDPACKGLTLDIDIVPGKTGHCNVSFDPMLGGDGPDHTFPPEIIAKFTDITKEYAPLPGTSENDANGLRIIDFYKRRLATSSQYARPDIDEGAKPAPAPAAKPKAEVDTPAENKPDIGDNLATALADLQ